MSHVMTPPGVEITQPRCHTSPTCSRKKPWENEENPLDAFSDLAVFFSFLSPKVMNFLYLVIA